jgi:hypothetical protein
VATVEKVKAKSVIRSKQFDVVKALWSGADFSIQFRPKFVA